MNNSFRPNVIDVEASGFGATSYPIEVGIALENGGRYCSLIKPMEGWDHWDETAQELHGIKRSHLMKHGKDVDVVCRELNELLDGETVYSDAWVVDKPWLDTLYRAAKMEPTYDIRPIEAVQTECQHENWDKVRQSMIAELGLQRHRASADAFLIQVIFMRTQEYCEIEYDTSEKIYQAG